MARLAISIASCIGPGPTMSSVNVTGAGGPYVSIMSIGVLGPGSTVAVLVVMIRVGRI